MKISTKGRYALRMLLDLAEHQSEGYIALKDIAARQDVSKKYLEQIISILNKSVGDILRATEGSLSPVACLDNEPVLCQRADMCTTLSVWKGLKKVIDDYVDGITLQDLLDQQRETYANDYVI